MNKFPVTKLRKYLAIVPIILLTGFDLPAQPNPFTIAKGKYQGLFYDTNGVVFQSSGSVSATVTDKGSFSGKIQFMGKSYAGSGQFTASGSYSNQIPRQGLSPLTVLLQLDLAGGNLLTGQIMDDMGGTAELMAYRAVYSKTNPAPQAGNYTMVLPGNDDSSAEPGGNGVATLSIDTLGNVNLKGTLGDGSKITQKTFVAAQGQWPFFAGLYSGNGCAIGWLTLTNRPETAVDGHVTWIKQTQPAAKFYPGGFTNDVEIAGSAYHFTTGIPLLNFAGGEISLSGGNLAEDVTRGFILGTNSQVTSTNGVKLKFTTTSGAFKGSVLDPASGKNILVNGVVLQNQNSGYGYFLGTNQSGMVLIGPSL